MSFDSLGLSPALLRAVAEQGYTQPTPIQGRVIPVVLEGRDVMAGAQTGTGKTAGFTLPLLQRLMAADAGNGRRRVRALILTPTRELAAQVGESVQIYGKHLPLKIGRDLRRRQHQSADRAASSRRRYPRGDTGPTARSRAASVISTCGTSRSSCSTKPIACSTWASCPTFAASSRCCRSAGRTCCSRPRSPRTSASSRTSSSLPPSASRSASATRRPKESSKPCTSPTRVRSAACCRGSSAPATGVRCSCSRARSTARIAWPSSSMHDGLSAAAIHGNKSQGARTRALADFKQGTVRVLVATDIAARGLDIDQLPHVVNYDLPEVARALCPPHRPHGTRGQRRPRGVARRARRAAAAEIHRATARLATAGPVARGLHATARRAPSRGNRQHRHGHRASNGRGNNDGRGQQPRSNGGGHRHGGRNQRRGSRPAGGEQRGNRY